MPLPACFNPGKDMVPIVQEAGWAPGTLWTGAEDLDPPEFDPRTFQPVPIPTTLSRATLIAQYMG